MQNKIGPLTYTTHKKFTWNGLITKHKTETINALRKNIGEKLLDIGLGNIFFGYDTKSTSTKTKIKWDYINWKACVQQKK